MAQPKRALGRGLEALIPGAGEPGVAEVGIDQIVANPRQPRTRRDEQALAELANSIAEHGILQPLLVSSRQLPSVAGLQEYQLIAGERRLTAARMAGLTHVPVVVRGAAEVELLELAVVENVQREDLGPLEEAAAYQQLAKEFGFTQEQIAAKVGKSRTAIANSLRLLNLPAEVRQALSSGAITEGHARALLGLRGAEQQLRALAVVTSRSLNVRDTEELVRTWDEPRPDSRKARKTDPEVAAIESVFREALGTKVTLLRGKKGGKLIIHFYSDEELQGLYDLMLERNS